MKKIVVLYGGINWYYIIHGYGLYFPEYAQYTSTHFTVKIARLYYILHNIQSYFIIVIIRLINYKL